MSAEEFEKLSELADDFHEFRVRSQQGSWMSRNSSLIVFAVGLLIAGAGAYQALRLDMQRIRSDLDNHSDKEYHSAGRATAESLVRIEVRLEHLTAEMEGIKQQLQP